jgi:hypothetical protein
MITLARLFSYYTMRPACFLLPPTKTAAVFSAKIKDDISDFHELIRNGFMKRK